MMRNSSRHSQHFQASQRSEGSVLDAGDVVFIQLTVREGREERGRVSQDKDTIIPGPCGLVAISDTVSRTLMDYGKSIQV